MIRPDIVKRYFLIFRAVSFLHVHLPKGAQESRGREREGFPSYRENQKLLRLYTGEGFWFIVLPPILHTKAPIESETISWPSQWFRALPALRRWASGSQRE